MIKVGFLLYMKPYYFTLFLALIISVLFSCTNKDLATLEQQKDSLNTQLSLLERQSPKSKTEVEELVLGYTQLKKRVISYTEDSKSRGYYKDNSTIISTIDEKISQLNKEWDRYTVIEEKEERKETLAAQLLQAIQGDWEWHFTNDDYMSGSVSISRYLFKIRGTRLEIYGSYSETLSGYELHEKPLSLSGDCEIEIDTEIDLMYYDIARSCFRNLVVGKDYNGKWTLFYYDKGKYTLCTRP